MAGLECGIIVMESQWVHVVVSLVNGVMRMVTSDGIEAKFYAAEPHNTTDNYHVIMLV